MKGQVIIGAIISIILIVIAISAFILSKPNTSLTFSPKTIIINTTNQQNLTVGISGDDNPCTINANCTATQQIFITSGSGTLQKLGAKWRYGFGSPVIWAIAIYSGNRTTNYPGTLLANSLPIIGDTVGWEDVPVYPQIKINNNTPYDVVIIWGGSQVMPLWYSYAQSDGIIYFSTPPGNPSFPIGNIPATFPSGYSILAPYRAGTLLLRMTYIKNCSGTLTC